MIFGSICSGIEAASLASAELGWKPSFFSEIDPFACAVLRQRQNAADMRQRPVAGGVPLWGDFTTLRIRHFRHFGLLLPDILVGGTPCQAFSIAGLRKGLLDPRGDLTLAFVRLLDAIENARRARGLGGAAAFWENVPGILSDSNNAFGCFLGLLSGEDDELVPSGERWTNAGYVLGPKRAIAWRTLDAQYAGLAQRRERVFVVAYPRDGRDPRQILFESEGVRRDSPPSREAGQNPARPIGSAPAGGSGYRNDADTADNLIADTLRGHPRPGSNSYGAIAPPLTHNPYGDHESREGLLVAFGGNNTAGPIDVATARSAHAGPHGRLDFETETFVAHVAHSLRAAGFDASEDGTGRGTPLVPIAYRTSVNDGAWKTGDPTDALTTSTDPCSHVIAFDETQITHPENRSNPQAGDASHPLTAEGRPPAVAFQSTQSGDRVHETHATLDANFGSRRRAGVLSAGVRRLTPLECERLQGLPDGYTAVTYRGKPAADGPRYRAIGNSWAIPVVRWIFERIGQVP